MLEQPALDRFLEGALGDLGAHRLLAHVDLAGHRGGDQRGAKFLEAVDGLADFVHEVINFAMPIRSDRRFQSVLVRGAGYRMNAKAPGLDFLIVLTDRAFDQSRIRGLRLDEPVARNSWLKSLGRDLNDIEAKH